MKTELELPSVAKQILELADGRKVFALYAQMGAGKTTLIKEICRQLGSKDNFSSPTYSIINQYEGNPASGATTTIFHLDLYRLKNAAEAYDAGVEDCLTEKSYCFIEWPELIETMLPLKTVRIFMRAEEEQRHLIIQIDDTHKIAAG